MEKQQNIVANNVVQGNKISRASYDFDVNQQKIASFAMFKLNNIYGILDAIKNDDPKLKLSDFQARFTVKEMCEVMDIDFNQFTTSNFIKVLDDLHKRECILTEGKRRKKFPLIIYSDFDKDDKKIVIVFNPYFFKEVFDPFCYSKGNLVVIGKFKRKASQRLYFYLLSYRNMVGKKEWGNPKDTWIISTTVSALRIMYGLPEDKIVRTNNFIYEYVKKAVDEINEFNFEFSVTYETKKKGRFLSEIIFTCVNTLNLIKLSKKDVQQKNYEKIELNNETKEIAYFKKMYPDEWNTLYKDEIAQENLFKLDVKSKEVFATSAVYAKMKKLHPKG